MSETWSLKKNYPQAVLPTLGFDKLLNNHQYITLAVPLAVIVASIWDVSVARMLALTPLPRPSAKTQMEVSSLEANTTRSPQSCSPALMRLT